LDNDQASTNEEDDITTGDGESWLAEQARLVILEDGI
jgi:hypothetical protein